MHLHIISTKQAKAMGLKFYFTGKPCPLGCIDLRYVSTQQCACAACREKANARTRVSRKGNPRVMAYQKAYLARNGEELRAKKRAKYRENPEPHLARTRKWREGKAGHLREYRARYNAENRQRNNETARAWREANKSRISEWYAEYYAQNHCWMIERSRLYYAANRDTYVAYARDYRKNNREAVSESQRRWRVNNPEATKRLVAQRRASLEQRIPLWFDEIDEFVIEEAFALAELRQESTGIAWHVDHMIPLRAKLASGLHCAENIQVIPAQLNNEKYNKMILTEPDEWLSAVVERRDATLPGTCYSVWTDCGCAKTRTPNARPRR